MFMSSDFLWEYRTRTTVTELLCNKFSFLVSIPCMGVSAFHYNDVVMSAMASQITSLTIVYSTVYLRTDQRKLQSSASLAFVRGIHRWPVNSPHKCPVTRKMFLFDDVIMLRWIVLVVFVVLKHSRIIKASPNGKFSALLVLYKGKPPVTGGFPS